MRETEWYKQDLFGLKTVDEAGKIQFNTTTGNHLQFSRDQLIAWVGDFV
jgi:palmitoyl-protein thioesterase